MNNAHIDAVMILGEALRGEQAFDFGAHDVTKRILSLLPVMLDGRKSPPPKEVYCSFCVSL